MDINKQSQAIAAVQAKASPKASRYLIFTK